jgi:bifunctional DNA-binding transcriptional regulator/antitoxin component of YhaV-PrlF toxin-antitoxin module
MASSYVMKVSSNGQVSIPADTRARWKAARVVLVDLGDRVVVRPLPEDPVGSIAGKYRGKGPNTVRARTAARAEEVSRERRKRR